MGKHQHRDIHLQNGGSTSSLRLMRKSYNRQEHVRHVLNQMSS